MNDFVEQARVHLRNTHMGEGNYWINGLINEIERERGRSDHFIEHGIYLAKIIRELERICPNVPRHFWLSAKKSYSVFMQEEADWLKRRVEWEKECFGDPPTLVFGSK